MTKKILCVIVITLALVCVLASCGHEHEWSEWQTTKEATCTTHGLRERTCECGEKESQSIAKLDHSFGEGETIQPNCLIEGKRSRFCERCGYEISYIISARTSHYFSWNGWIVTKAATCTEEGEKECKCSYCDEKETETIHMLEHSYGEWQTTKEATCTTDGLRERICECGEKETETIPAGHKYSNGICDNCNKGLINIILPNTPITVHRFNYNGSVDVTGKITSIAIEKITERNEGTYYIRFSWAGEKTYDDDGNNYSSSVAIAYKLYDSEGYVVKSGTSCSVGVCVGEKFKDQKIEWGYIDLDPNETYTLEILSTD